MLLDNFQNWTLDLYVQHIKLLNGCYEMLTKFQKKEKNNINDFSMSFTKLINSFIGNTYNEEIININNNTILNGAHRLSCHLFFNREILTNKTDFEGLKILPIYFTDREKYKNNLPLPGKYTVNSINLDYLNFAIFEYIKLKKNNVRIMCFFSDIFNEYEKEIVNFLESIDVKIIYKKEIKLNQFGMKNLIKELYLKEEFVNIDWKTEKCFENKKESTIITFAIESDNIDSIQKLSLSGGEYKNKIRKIFNNHHSLHVSDNVEDTYRLSCVLFNQNTIEFYNTIDHSYDKKMVELFNQYDKLLMNKENYCITSSFILGLYGLRKPNDIDYIHNDIELDMITSHNKYSHYYPENIKEIIYNPKNYFYFHGHKCCTLDIISKFKLKRNETPKDIEDINIINNYEDNKILVKKHGNSFYIKDKFSKNWFLENYSNWENDTFIILDYFKNTKNGIYIDVGGWIGATPLYAASNFNKIIVLEPDIEAVKRLKENLSVNNFKNLTLIEKALSNKTGKSIFGGNGELGNSESTLLVSQSDFFNYEGRHTTRWKDNQNNIIEVETISIDKLILDENINPYEISLIKIDIEGGEKILIPSIKDFLNKYKPNLYISLHYCYLKINDIESILKILFNIYNNCYTVVDLEHKSININTILKYKISSVYFTESNESQKNLSLVPKFNYLNKVTVLILTNKTHKSLECLELLLLNLQKNIPELNECNKLICHDFNENDTEEYYEKLTNITKKFKNTTFYIGKRNFTYKNTKYSSSHWGINILDLITKCNTTYFLFCEHDWIFTDKINIKHILQLFDENNFINYIKFNKRYELGPWDIYSKFIENVNLTRVCNFTNWPYFSRKSIWIEVWLQKLIDNGPITTVEHDITLNITSIRDLYKNWGLFTYGKIGDKPLIKHTDGRDIYQNDDKGISIEVINKEIKSSK
tara:strand:- start:2015 stop:4801 length:2787 start_codon:yes stop_codon:yes gene_type:complete